MKRLFLYITILSFSALTFNSCDVIKSIMEDDPEENEEEPVIPALDCETEEISVSGVGGEYSVEFISNMEFDLECSETWVKTTARDKTDNGAKITFKVEENDTMEERKAYLHARYDKLSKIVWITQSSLKAFNLDNEFFEVSSRRENIDVTIISNYDYTVRINDKWITEMQGTDKEPGSGHKHVHTFVVSANPDYDSRTGTIEFEADGEILGTVTIAQESTKALILNDKEISMNAEGGKINVEIATNVGYTYEITEGREWVEEDMTAGMQSLDSFIHTFTVSPNGGRQSRSASILFKSESGLLQETLSIFQDSRNFVLKIGHGNIGFSLPEIGGQNVTGTVDWGDGSYPEDYYPYATHNYFGASRYWITLSLKSPENVRFNDIAGINVIDLSGF